MIDSLERILMLTKSLSAVAAYCDDSVYGMYAPESASVPCAIITILDNNLSDSEKWIDLTFQITVYGETPGETADTAEAVIEGLNQDIDLADWNIIYIDVEDLGTVAPAADWELHYSRDILFTGQIINEELD